MSLVNAVGKVRRAVRMKTSIENRQRGNSAAKCRSRRLDSKRREA